MAETPPEDFVHWATNDTAELTDPGTTLEADGWVVGDAPAASHFNYVLNSATTWAEFISQTLAARIAFSNTEHTTDSPFTTTCSQIYIRFDALANRWYASVRDSVSLYEVEVYDSEDGETWNSLPAPLDLGVADGDNLTHVVSDGSRCAIGIEEKIYNSSDFTIENINHEITDLTDITKCRALVWDDSNKLWIAAGSDGTDGYIETSPDLVTWTTAATATQTGDQYEGLATDGAGNSCAITENATVNMFSSDGLTWTLSGTDPAIVFEDVVWAPSISTFLAVDNSDNMYHSTDGDDWADTSLNVVNIFTTPEFTWALQTNDEMLLLHPGVTGYDGGFTSLGEVTQDQAPNPVFTDSTVHGGQGKLVWTYDTTRKLAVARYGEKN